MESTLHRRDIKIILDYVPNHTSDQHAWFVDSRSSRSSAKRDWYVWADPSPNGGPPNNWLSRFGGSAWQWDENTGQYYYHSFLLEQPDLNCAIRRCAPLWLTYCDSGCGAAWTVFASTPAQCLPKTRCCRTILSSPTRMKTRRRRND